MKQITRTFDYTPAAESSQPGYLARKFKAIEKRLQSEAKERARLDAEGQKRREELDLKVTKIRSKA